MAKILYGTQSQTDKDYIFTLSGDNGECVEQCQQLAGLYDMSFDQIYNSWRGGTLLDWHEFYVVLLFRGLCEHELNWANAEKLL